jgi:hypothetical protein
MDSNRGDLQNALSEFQRNIEKFQKNGFSIRTVCQHGNPVIERNGYDSNRDFFRNQIISTQYHNISEIMVNYRERLAKEYQYISDAGYGWKIIFDPETNDILDSEYKNIFLGTLDNVLEIIENGSSVIVSTHPHRWYGNVFYAKLKISIFKIIKITVKTFVKQPRIKKFFGKFYFLAKIF